MWVSRIGQDLDWDLPLAVVLEEYKCQEKKASGELKVCDKKS